MILHSPESRSDTLAIPPGFIPFADGKLLVRTDYVDRFHERGWLTPGDVIDAGEVNIFRRLSDRENGIVVWSDDEGLVSRSFIKRHTHPKRTRSPWNKAGFLPAGRKEGWASEECRRAGVGVAPVVAVGVEEGAESTARSFFMSEELVGFLPADDFAPTLEHLDATHPRRRAFLVALADLARRLHNAKLYHRDFYWCHLFVREIQEAKFDVRLIDLQRVDRPAWRQLRWRIKDLAQFVFSAPAGFLCREERRLWFQRYLGRAELGRSDRAFLSLVEARASIYRWREANR